SVCSYKLLSSLACSFICFFQAEDGIRDRNVTGVQTCALPIFSAHLQAYIQHLFNFAVEVGGTLQGGIMYFVNALLEAVNLIAKGLEHAVNARLASLVKGFAFFFKDFVG